MTDPSSLFCLHWKLFIKVSVTPELSLCSEPNPLKFIWGQPDSKPLDQQIQPGTEQKKEFLFFQQQFFGSHNIKVSNCIICQWMHIHLSPLWQEAWVEQDATSAGTLRNVLRFETFSFIWNNQQQKVSDSALKMQNCCAVQLEVC